MIAYGLAFLAGFLVGCWATVRDVRMSPRNNVVRIDSARRYDLVKNGEL